MNEMENRLSRDLLDDLLEGIPADVAADRASAQGHDLGVPHDLILCAWSSDTGPGVTTGTSIISDGHGSSAAALRGCGKAGR